MLGKTKVIVLLAILLPAILVSCEEEFFADIAISGQPDTLPQKTSFDLLSLQTDIIKGDTARVVIKTFPWNLIESDSCFFLTDTIGQKTDECAITGNVMMPDSTWRISLVQKKGSSSWVRICANVGDSTYCTVPINVKSVAITSYPSILIGGAKVSVGDKTTDYSVILPAVTDFSNIKMTMVWFGGDSATVNGKLFSGANNMVDFSRPATLTLWKNGASKSFNISVQNTGLPVVRITTPKAITSKEDWMSGCSIAIDLPNGVADTEKRSLSIRGRGNASWNDTDKKSYALKLDEKSKILGMAKNKRWILLANFKDRTLLRNDVTFWLARQTSQEYVVNGCFVELELNGQYRGNYYLCEQGRISSDRININDIDPDNPGTGGFLLESDAYFNDESKAGIIGVLGGFVSSNMQIPYSFKQPDEDEMTQAAFDKVKNFIDKFEYAVMTAWTGDYEKLLDVDQCIDYAIIQELTGNQDFYNSYPVNGPHSMYFHVDNIDNGGKLKFGHLWDFDYWTYDPQRLYGWTGLDKHGSGQEFYYWHLLSKSDSFRARFIERWDELKNGFLGAVDYIDSMADMLRLSEYCNAHYPENAKNGKGWIPIENKNNGGSNADQKYSYQEAINSMKECFLIRWQWMDDEIHQRHGNQFFPKVRQ